MILSCFEGKGAIKMSKHHITQHKRFVLYIIHPNPALLRASVEILQQTGIRASQELFRMVVEMTKKCRASFMLGRYMKWRFKEKNT